MSLNAYFPYAMSFGMSLLNGILIPIIPLLAFGMGASQIELGIIGSAAPLINLPMSFVTGRMSDRFGRKPLIAASSLLYAMAYISYSASPSPLHLVGVKLLEGLATALLWPPVEALLADNAMVEGHALASNFGASWSLGTALGALIASWVIGTGRYRDPLLPAATVSLAFSMATLAVISDKRAGLKSEAGRGIAERSSPSPLRYESVWLAAFLYAFCQGIVFALYPPFAKNMGVPTFVIGLAITSLMMGRTLVFILFRRIKARFKMIAMTGSAVIGLAALPLSLSVEPWVILPLALTFGLGLGLVYSASIMIALSVDGANRGKYAGLFEGSIGAGYLLGPLIGGSIAQVTLQGPYVICSAGALVSLLSIIRSKIE